jgi:SAM-dependent methyltransferase
MQRDTCRASRADMDTQAATDFTPRSCPHCGSAHGRTLLELTPDAILQSNWSYRLHAAATIVQTSTQQFPIMECQACGFIYAGLLPGAAFIQRLYDVVIDSDAARKANLSRASLAQKMGDMSALFRLVPAAAEPLRLLDYGCGFGPALEVVRSLPGVQALGYETSAVRLQDLADRGLSATGDLTQVSQGAPFDVVLLDNVLEHLPNPRSTLKFIRAVCAPGAVLYVSVPSITRETIAAQHGAVRGGAPLLMDINPWEHLNYFDLAHLDSLLADFGLLPFGQSSFPDQVNIGLRAAPSFHGRLMNGLVSMLRMWRFLRLGEGLHTVNRRFYRLDATRGSRLATRAREPEAATAAC